METAKKEKRGYQKITAKFVYTLKKSRDTWKRTAKKYREKIRYFEVKVRDLTTSREAWKSKALHYQKLLDKESQPSQSLEVKLH